MKTTTRKAEYDADIRAIIAEVRAGLTFNEAVFKHWCEATPLFRFLTPDGRMAAQNGCECGCLTMIKTQPNVFHAWTHEFTRIVREDRRIPERYEDATPLSLFAFRELQMLADDTFRRDYLLEQGLIHVIEEEDAHRRTNRQPDRRHHSSQPREAACVATEADNRHAGQIA